MNHELNYYRFATGSHGRRLSKENGGDSQLTLHIIDIVLHRLPPESGNKIGFSKSWNLIRQMNSASNKHVGGMNGDCISACSIIFNYFLRMHQGQILISRSPAQKPTQNFVPVRRESESYSIFYFYFGLHLNTQ